MRKLLPALLVLAAVAPAGAWEERPMTVTAGRAAAILIGERNVNPVRGLIRMTVGERVSADAVAIQPVREVCLEVVDGVRRHIDAGCAPAEVFIDDLWQVATGEATIASAVTNEWGVWVADSQLTFSADMARDALAGCASAQPVEEGGHQVGSRTFVSFPWRMVMEAEAELECAAEGTASLSSEFLGEARGKVSGVIGPYAGQAWRGPNTEPDSVVIGGRSVVDSEVTWDQPIVVAPGGSLIVLNSKVWLDWTPPVCTYGTAGYCHANITVMPGGRLVVKDSEFDTRNWAEDQPNSGWAIVVAAGTVELENSRFLHQRNFVVQGGSLTPSTIKNSEFGWGVNGITFMRGSQVHVQDSFFHNNLIALSLRDTTGVVENNVFDHNLRHFQDPPFGRALDIQNTIVGEKAWVTDPVISGNTIANGVEGILNLNGFASTYRDNVLAGNEIAAVIGLPGGDDTLNHNQSIWEGNIFDSNRRAVQVYVSGTRAEGTTDVEQEMRGNSFLSTCTEVTAVERPNVNLTVDVSGNWWGSAAGPQDRSPSCPVFAGATVVADDWLTEAP